MFEIDKIHVFWRGSDMMIALPETKAKGADAEIKAALAIIFDIDPGAIRANHKYNQLPEGWKCFRVEGGKLPRQIRDPGTKKYVPWDKILVVKDKPKVTPRTISPAKAEIPPEVKREDDAEMVVVPAHLLATMIEQNNRMLAAMELVIQQAGLSLIKR